MASRRVTPTVVLVGRPNVGKSTLFNRITRTRRAIVAPIAGTTRDAMGQPAEYGGVPFQLFDTGGMFGASADPLHDLVVEKGKRAIANADIIVMMVDAQDGLVPGDEAIAQAARAADVPVVLAINKTDDHKARRQVLEFYQLGFDAVFEIAAEHGTGVAELLDEVVARLKDARPKNTDSVDGDPDEIRVAIIGRPNVGKSSMVNRLLREERVLVSDLPGTTRDAIDTILRWQKKTYRIVDTAGIRRPGRVARSGQIESISVIVAKRAIERADVAVLLIDSAEGPTDQDATIAGEAQRAGCGVIIVSNKWDLVKEKGPDFYKLFDDKVRQQFKFLDYAPILHISALTGERAPKLLETIDIVAEARKHRVGTGELNRFIEAVTAVHPPASPGRRAVKILYVAQTSVAPPTFVFFTNIATTFHFSYERYLENRLRESFGF
ncbi:MAG: ribosome biogenesis GTPase Der, partial [Acidobacteria bacterium]|nr:ribosome biogenesis GTPase Der [Acidobacteriota bacterium]